MFDTKAMTALTLIAIALAGCETSSSAPPATSEVPPEVVAMGQSIALHVANNPQPGADVSVQDASAEGRLVLITVRVPEDNPGSEFFTVDGRQTEVIAALEQVVCTAPDITGFKSAKGVVQAYIDDVTGDRVATIFPDNCPT